MMNIIKKTIVLTAVLCVAFSLVSVSAAENLFDPENSFEELQIFKNETGAFTNDGMNTVNETFSIPGLTNNYTFSAHVKILEIGEKDWNGLRIIVGSSQEGQCKLVVTKNWGTRFEFKSYNMDDKLWDKGPIRLSEGFEFDFVVVREGRNVTLTLNDIEQGTIEIPEEYDTFDAEDDYNLGFETSDCWVEISNIVVNCPEAEANRTPVPENTPETEPTPDASAEPTTSAAAEETGTATPSQQVQTQTAGQNTPQGTPSSQAPSGSNSSSNSNDDDGGVSPAIIVVICVAAAAVIAAVVIIIVKKTKNKK